MDDLPEVPCLSHYCIAGPQSCRAAKRGSMARLRLALDIGGTFTDVVMADAASGALWTAKTPSTPADPSRGFFEGVERIFRIAEAAPSEVAAVFHGTTIATNAVLERKGARTGMLVTAGFRYVLEIGRHEIPRKENLFVWAKPKRPVPPRLILEVPERVLRDGRVEQPLDEGACREAVRRLKSFGVEAVAIVFLHSYANSAHERRAAAIVAEEFPQAAISISCDVLPVFREYERSMATALNAYVQRLVGTYLGRIESGLATRKIAAPLLVMKSNGGVAGPAQAGRQAIHMALSGPAAGAIGASFVARSAGCDNAMSIDIGGTSADVSLIRGGSPASTTEGEIGPFPLALPMIDIHSIGAGGGSIARVTDIGSLQVGPQSAGAAPGPACYGRGGTQATVTDAHVVLGRLPTTLLAGEMRLEAQRARAAVERDVAHPLAIDTEDAAEGMIRIVNANMTGALKVVSVERGYDPREFSLIAFGGAGPLHAVELARALGARDVLVPRHPGLLCALGLLATDLQFDFARTALQRGPDYDLQAMHAVWQELNAEAEHALSREGVPPERRRFVALADLRYAKQGFELSIEAPPWPLDPAWAARLIESFHRRHEQLYTFAQRTIPVEVVTLRLRAIGLVDKISLPEIASAAGSAPASYERRSVRLDGTRCQDVPAYRRETLLAGHRVRGPAIIDQLDTTSLVFPEQTAAIDRHGNLIVSLA
jgi:N-methylhydantoinase A